MLKLLELKSEINHQTLLLATPDGKTNQLWPLCRFKSFWILLRVNRPSNVTCVRTSQPARVFAVAKANHFNALLKAHLRKIRDCVSRSFCARFRPLRLTTTKLVCLKISVSRDIRRVDLSFIENVCPVSILFIENMAHQDEQTESNLSQFYSLKKKETHTATV